MRRLVKDQDEKIAWQPKIRVVCDTVFRHIFWKKDDFLINSLEGRSGNVSWIKKMEDEI